MFTAYWEYLDNYEDDFRECEDAVFDTFIDAYNWLGYRLTDKNYYCVIFGECGKIAKIGWLP